MVRLVRVVELVSVVRMVEVIRVVEVIKVVEVVYRYEKNLGVKGSNKNKKDVGLPMTMPQAAGKKLSLAYDRNHYSKNYMNSSNELTSACNLMKNEQDKST